MADFEQEGVVSIWLFRDAEDLADAGKDVLRDLCGVDFYDIDAQEGVTSDDLQPVSKLLEQISYSDSFIDEALNAAERMCIKNALGVMAQFDFAYDLGKVERAIARDPIFIGHFGWHR